MGCHCTQTEVGVGAWKQADVDGLLDRAVRGQHGHKTSGPIGPKNQDVELNGLHEPM